MAYEKITWKNREVEKPRTYTKVDNSDGTITLSPAEGNIIEPGTPIIADNMNHIEQGIEDVDQAIDSHVANKTQHIPYATASGTDTYTVSISGISSLTEGLSIKVKFTNANTGTATLNINSLGAKNIVKSNGNALSSGNIKAGQILHLVYTGTSFQLLGEGGEYGTAQAGDVLSGKTIGTESGLITGAMPNRGAISNTIATQNGQIAIPQGYHNGSGIVKAQFANLIAENVKSGINIGGILGNFPGVYYVETTPQASKKTFCSRTEVGSGTSETTVERVYLDISENFGSTPVFIVILATNKSFENKPEYPTYVTIYSSNPLFTSYDNIEYNIAFTDSNGASDDGWILSRTGVYDAEVSSTKICLPLAYYAASGSYRDCKVFIFK